MVRQSDRKEIQAVRKAFTKASLGGDGVNDDIGRFLDITRGLSLVRVMSDCKYPENYRVKGLGEQIRILRRFFPGTNGADEEISKQPLPTGAEGWFAFPAWWTVAETYVGAVEKVFAALYIQRKGEFEVRLDLQYLRRTAKTARALQKIGNEQKDRNVLVVPAQLGRRYWCYSVRQTREAFPADEFGLGGFETGCILLTHPERLASPASCDDLWLSCAGDECVSETDGASCVPYFRCRGKTTVLGKLWHGFMELYHSSASGFIL